MNKPLRVLWLSNVVLPGAAAALGLPAQVGGSWMAGQLAAFAPMLAQGQLEIIVMTPSPKLNEPRAATGADGVRYIAMPGGKGREAAAFRRVLTEYSPDVVHIFGTEYAHNAALLAEAGPARCVVSIQGLVGFIARHYTDGLPNRFRRRNPIKMAMKHLYAAGVVADEQRTFAKNALREAAMLRAARHVIGRTGWDRACLWRINPSAAYHPCGEVLRPEFYNAPVWNYDNCDKHTIFMSQGYYPVKGAHVLIEQLPAILERWPGARVLIGGQKPYTLGSATQPIVDFFFEYQGYLRCLCKKLGVQHRVEWLGPLSAAEMRDAYLRSNVFCNPSTIENSPNSLAEAMALGVPVVASAVGGVPGMLQHGAEGILYPAREGYLLPWLVEQVFGDPAAAAERGLRARERALRDHDPAALSNTLLAIYASVREETLREETAPPATPQAESEGAP